MRNIPNPIARPLPLVVREVQPVTCTQTAPGHWFTDFGRAAFGTIRLVIEAPSACELTVELGERLAAPSLLDRTPPGTVRYRRMTVPLSAGHQAVQVVIPSDDYNTAPEAIKMPAHLFEVLPFRYAQISGPEGVRLHGAVQLAVNYPFDETAASFECSDERLKRVWELCRYSIQATSFLGVYVDGDRERLPYEGDAYLNQLSHYCVDSEYQLARHSLEYLLHYPTWPTEWALHFVPMAWADYQYTGETVLLERYYDVLRDKSLLALAREDGLLSTLTGLVTPEFLERMHLDTMQDLVDWPPANPAAGVPGERDDYDMVPVKTVVNAFHWWNLRLLSRIAAVLGKEADRLWLAERANLVADSLQRLCFDAERGIYRDGEGSTHASLHANMLPAAVGLVPEAHRASVAAFLRSRGMACSVYGAQYLLEGLYRLGEADYALSLLTAEDDRGWLNMLRLGSTITLEAWDTKYKANLDWNHAWGAAPANLIPRFVMGVRPAAPGFSAVTIAPQPGSLQWARAQVPTPLGPVRVELEQAGSKKQLKVELPEGVTPQVEAPGMEVRFAPLGKH